MSLTFCFFSLLLLLCECRKGLFFTEKEIEIWKERAKSGPFSSSHDDFLGSPSDFENIKKNAEEFVEMKRGNDIWNGIENESSRTGCKTRDAGFYYLLTDNSTFANAVRLELLEQIRIKEVSYINKPLIPRPRDGMEFHRCGMWIRFLFAYDFVKDTINEEERKEIDQFFWDVGNWYLNNTDTMLAELWPNRLNRSYVERGNFALWETHVNEYTHVNDNASIGNLVYVVAKFYNNRRAAHLVATGLIGVFLQDEVFIEHVKLFGEEWLKFAVYPDGTQAEFHRNGQYGYAHTGVFYSSITASFYSIFAEALARTGDFSMYEYSTSEGFFTSECDEGEEKKNLWMVIQNHIGLYDGSIKRYQYNESDPTPKEEYLLRSYHPQPEKNRNYRFFCDVWYVQSNHYYKSDYYLQIYSRSNISNVPQYETGDNIQGDGTHYSPFEGINHIFPGLLFMFGKMEQYNIPYVEKQDQEEIGTQIFVAVSIALISIILISIILIVIGLFISIFFFVKKKKNEKNYSETEMDNI